VPRESGEHAFGTRRIGAFTLTVDGKILYDGVQAMGDESDPFEAFSGAPLERGKSALTEGVPVHVALLHATVTVQLRNSGARAGREVVQLYLAPAQPGPHRPGRRLAGFASVTAAPGERVRVRIELPDRAFESWDEAAGSWRRMTGAYEIQACRSVADRRLTAALTI
jgi:hypothetical protein